MAFGVHWEWRGFGPLAPEAAARVESLPRKFPSAQRVVDEYLWVPGARANVKLRAADLKFKRLLERRGAFELWEEDERENHAFPLGPEPLEKLCAELGAARPPPPALGDPRELLAWLERAAPAVRRVRVAKTRTQHDWSPPDLRAASEPVTVELARIEAPEGIASVAFEHPRLELVEEAVRAMRFEGALRPLSYLDAVGLWARGASVLRAPEAIRVLLEPGEGQSRASG